MRHKKEKARERERNGRAQLFHVFHVEDMQYAENTARKRRKEKKSDEGSCLENE